MRLPAPHQSLPLVTMAATGLLLLWSCDDVVGPPPEPPEVDACQGLSPLTVSLVPPVVRVNGAASVVTSGGTGHALLTLSSNGSGGQLSGDRYLAGPTPDTDVITASDECGGAASVTVAVQAAFSVAPARATVRPATRFAVVVTGAAGSVTFAAQGAKLASGGSISPTGSYQAGANAGLDLIVVRDTGTGEQVLLQYQVDAAAHLRGAPARLALPSGSVVPLATVDGSGVIDWRVVSGGGALEGQGQQTSFRAGAVAGETTVLEGTDRFTAETTQVKVRVLTELTRPGNRAQGRRTDVASIATGDFDGDGLEDLALGVPESDLSRPQGGAVFIFKGTALGLPSEATWTITGATDTAQLGSVMAAGDLDGDGRVDLAVSAPGDDVTFSDSGGVYLYTVTATGPTLLRPVLTGIGKSSFGAALAIADVDGDGRKDLVVGSPGADLAPGAGYAARGVIDIFLQQPGVPLPDLGAIRLSGFDLAADGSTRRLSNLRAGRSLVAADLNDDGKADLAFLTTVNNTLLDGAASPKAVSAVQVHFGRASSPPFAAEPDVFVLPANEADGDEGTWKLLSVPGEAGRAPRLIAVADRLDSPNLSSDGGAAGGVNAGGALLFDLSSLRPTGAPGSKPTQVGRKRAIARAFGDEAGIAAGRGAAIADLDGDGALELVLGAPYAWSASIPNAGKLVGFRLAGLTGGAQVNRPQLVRSGAGVADLLGTAIAMWNGRPVAMASRASTALGDYTGRLDFFGGGPEPAEWTVSSVELPSRPASQGFGRSVALGVVQGKTRALVAVPFISGPGANGVGGEVGAGQALWYADGEPASAHVLAEGATTAYQRDGGWRAFGGRGVGADVAMTDFDGDGRLDAVVAAPGFGISGRAPDGGVSAGEYAVARPACVPPTAQTPGAVLVYLGQNDGSFREGLRAWAVRDIPGCTVPDGGASTFCQRAALGGNGLAGRFDFNGDGRQDVAATRTNGLEVLAGQAPDDAALTKPTMACGVLYSLPTLPATWVTSAPVGLGDLDGDGCDEVAVRYSDNGNRQGLIIAFGFDASGAHCGGHVVGAALRLSGDPETGSVTMRLGVAAARAGRVLGDGKDYVAISADLYAWEGVTQPAVLLLESAALVAKRPSSGMALVGLLNDGLVPIPLVPSVPTPGFGRRLVGNLDVTKDGVVDLLVSAPGASINGAGTGAVFVYAGGTLAKGPVAPALLVVGDATERGAFGQDLSVSAVAPATLAIGAPQSYRSGTSNGTAFIVPLDF